MTFKHTILLTACIGLSAVSVKAGATTIYGVSSTGKLVVFDSASPASIQTMNISGLGVGERIEGIDFDPTDQKLYALTITDTVGTDEGRIYTLDPGTSSLISITSTPFSTTLVDGSSYGFDLNPVVNRLRVVNDADENMRVNPLTGTLVSADTALNPPNPTVVGLAHDRNVSGASATTLFAIDAASDKLVRVGGVDGSPSPNGGVLTDMGPLGVDTSSEVGFDIDGAGTAFASLTVGGVPGFYTINLTTGAATLVGTIGNGSLPMADITAAPSAGSLALDAATYTVAENAANAVVKVQRTGGSFGSVSIDYATSNGTALAGSDYAFSSGTLTFASGETEKSITIPVLDNFTADGDRSFALSLSDPMGGATLGATAEAEITITDDESPQPGIVQFALSNILINEDGDSADVLISRTGGSEGEVSVTVSTTDGTAKAGSDYTALNQTVTFADGDTADKVISVAITDDLTEETNETLTLSLSDPSGGAALGTLQETTLTILDDEKSSSGGGCQLIR